MVADSVDETQLVVSVNGTPVERIERNVWEFLEMLDEGFPDVDQPMHTERELVESRIDSLSDREREVLDAAYAGGFFERPRESAGEEIAELFGVSQPTVTRHLRFGGKQLLTALFGER